MKDAKVLIDKIVNKKAKIVVIGLGYVGLPIALEFAKKGFFVYGLDNNRQRVDNLIKGNSYITDISSESIKIATRSERFLPTAKEFVLQESDIVIICVPTPLRKRKMPNISYIIKATRTIARHLHPHQLIILESTTYPGTTRDIVLPILEKRGLKEGKDFFLAFSPERIDPGSKKYTFAKIPKVVGGISKEATRLTKKLYSRVIDKVIPVSSSETAEVVKLLENTFRIVNIGLINEFAMLCNKLKIDVWEVVEAAKTKPFGFMPFYPGPGLGGHCLDGREFVFIKNENGVKTATIASFIDRISKDPLCAKKSINGVLYIKPPSDYKMLTFNMVTKKSQFNNIGMLSRRYTDNCLYEIVTNDNRKIRVSDLHPMLIQTNRKLRVKFAKDLRIGEQIPFASSIEYRRLRPNDNKLYIDLKHGGFVTSVIKDIVKTKGNYLYSAEIEDTHTIVTSYGMIVHNCIPADPLYLSWKARKVGFRTKMIDLASRTNLFMPHYVVHRAEALLNEKGKDISKAKILILGVTYKKDVKDLREAPALDIIELLQKRGTTISYSDPYISYLNIKDISLKNTKLTSNTLSRNDLTILTTDHKRFNYKTIAKSAKLILDTRNAFGIRRIKAEQIVKL